MYMHKAKSITPYLLLTIVPLIWGSNFIVGKVLIDALPPFSIAAGRFLIGALILCPWLLMRKEKKKIAGPLMPKILIMGITGVFAFNSLLYIGLKYTTAINATLIGSFNPIVTIYFSWLILRENITLKQILGSVISIVGIIIIESQGSWSVLYNLDFNAGDLIIFANTFIWAIFTVLGKNVMNYLSPLETASLSIVAGLPFLVIVSGWELYHINITISWPVALGILYLGLFATVLAFVWHYKGIQAIGVAKAAIFYNLIPVYSIFLASFFLQEKVQPWHIVGGFCVVLGILLSSVKLNVTQQGGKVRNIRESF